jgi:hypothetical protein
VLACAAAGIAAIAYLGLSGFGWNDYEAEAQPAYNALTGGHVWRFLTLAPSYGGSLEMRAPFAFLPSLWHGGEQAVYLATSVPCQIAAGLLGLWLLTQMRGIGHGRLARIAVVAVCVANPITVYALQYGHPEELLGAVLCVAAVLAAQRGHANWSGVLLGLAIANKEWGLLAIGPVLLALPAGRRRPMTLAGAIALAFYLPLMLPTLSGESSFASAGPVAAGAASPIFQPWQLWWFLGTHAHLVHNNTGGVMVGYRAQPAWLPNIPHPLIIGLGVPVTALAWRRGADAMLALALLLALRCALDTLDIVYYVLPFIFALLAWETLRWKRPPLLALSASLIAWLLFEVAPAHLSPDGEAAAFAVVAVGTLLALAIAVTKPGAQWRSLFGTGRLQQRPNGSTSAPISAG